MRCTMRCTTGCHARRGPKASRCFRDDGLLRAVVLRSQAHDTREFARVFDAALPQHLEILLRENPRTLFVVMGDHGPSNGADQNEPFLALFVPTHGLESPWGRRHHLADVLAANERRLVTPADLHMTIKHAVVVWGRLRPDFCFAGSPRCSVAAGETERAKRADSGLFAYIPMTSGHRARSLFTALPPNRSCSDAGIHPHHCQRAGVWQPLLRHQPLWVFHDILHRVNLFNRDKPACRQFRLDVVLSTVARRPRARPTAGLGAVWATDEALVPYKARFRTIEGRLVFDVSFGLGHGGAPGSGRRIYRLRTMRQVTRYAKYQGCTPTSGLAEFCVCA